MGIAGTEILKKSLTDFWYIPKDVFLRVAEAVIWQKQKFESPILDIGCGDASMAKFMYKDIKRIDVGVDINKDSVLGAKKSGFYQQVRLADATKMPFKAKKFKTVISNCTFEHIENDRQAVKEAGRVLKKGGKLMLTVPSKRYEKAMKRYFKGKKKAEAYNKRVEHRHYRDLKGWKKILKGNGLEVVKHEYYFPDKAVSMELRLFRLATFKPYKRELWSYMIDPRFERLFPKKLIATGFYWLLRSYFKDMWQVDGNMLFIVARKR